MNSLLLILGFALGTAIAEDCWWTGCQPNDWATTGCGQYGRDERGREGCADGRGVQGNKYKCCAKEGGNGGDGGNGGGGAAGKGL